MKIDKLIFKTIVLILICIAPSICFAGTSVWSYDKQTGNEMQPATWFYFAQPNLETKGVLSDTDEGYKQFSATLYLDSDQYSTAGFGFVWKQIKNYGSGSMNDADVNLSAYDGLCLTYKADRPFRLDLRQPTITDYNYYGVVLPAKDEFAFKFLKFQNFAQEDGWGEAVALDLTKQSGVQFSYKMGLALGLDESDSDRNKNVITIAAISLADNESCSSVINPSNELPTVSKELVINAKEDAKYTFTSSEFNFKHPTQDFQSVIITSLPAKGSLLLNNKAVSKDQEIAVANLGKLTYQAAANDFGNKYTTFKYKVVGDGTGDNTSIEYTATVHVIPVNDKPTAASDVIFSVSEIDHEVSGRPITVTDVANERDVDTYTYILVNESNSDYAAFNQLFEIVKLSNQNATIKVKSGAEFEYNNKSQYVVYANIKDDAATETQTVKGPQSTGLFKITVKIVDENHTPSIEDQTFSIAEKSSDGSDWSSGKTIGVVKSSDSDDDALTYSVTTANVPFAFKKGTNWLVVSDGSMLDYETKPSWTFTVSVSDGVLSAEADITVNLTDGNESPTYEKTEYVFTIHEHASKGELVGSVVAGDEDTWSVLGYEILDYVEGSGDASIFNIDKKGDIYLFSSSLNYEMQKTYRILAKATDNGKTYGAKNERIDFKDLFATTLVTIEIIDDPDNPEIIDDDMKGYDVEENTIDQNSPTGMEIACLEVKDEDAGQVATLVPYVTDNGDTDAERLFDAKIKKDGSKYKLCLIVKDDSRLDYESIAHIHSVDIGVKDDDELTAKVTKTINLVDVNEKPIISDFTTFSFYENKGDDYPIGRLYSDDVDTSKAFTQNVFTVVGGDADLFSITENGYILTKRNFDYDAEKRHAYELEISLSDNNPEMYPKLTTSATISIMLKNMPEAPIITSIEFSVKEKSEAGELIGVIEAVDPDGDDVLAFSLYDESTYVTVSSDGEIRVREGADIDYDKMHDFIIMVIVKDKDGLESESAIAIKVIDIKDESSSSSVAKSSSSGKTVASSSSQKSKSSSSSEEREDESSSSSSGKTVASSSSQKSKSSSSGAEREGESSSSSRNDKKSSSSSKVSDDDNMDFYIKMTGTFEFEIVLGETLPAIAKQYAVLDMKGQVLSVGELSDKSARVKVPTAGAYIVKIGLGYRRVNVR